MTRFHGTNLQKRLKIDFFRERLIIFLMQYSGVLLFLGEEGNQLVCSEVIAKVHIVVAAGGFMYLPIDLILIPLFISSSWSLSNRHKLWNSVN